MINELEGTKQSALWEERLDGQVIEEALMEKIALVWALNDGKEFDSQKGRRIFQG